MRILGLDKIDGDWLQNLHKCRLVVELVCVSRHVMVELCNSANLATNARYLQVDVRVYCGIVHIGVSVY